ncbi:MAG: DUF177 domain-containing protein [Alphaproteobacteria bacterium]|nr:DUF177 domain-containing protein [Alphaproteobacteria bacterium]
MRPPVPEFSRPLALRDLGPEGTTLRIEASAEECAALARRFGLAGIARLAAELWVEPMAGPGTLRLEGRLEAAVRQTCVVTLEPFDQAVAAHFERLYAPPGDEAPGAAGEGAGGEDVVEPLAGDSLDLGEVVAEELALDLDPYPRAPGVDTSEVLKNYGVSADNAADAGPFAALAKLKRDPGA